MPTPGSQIVGLTGAGAYLAFGTETAFNSASLPTFNKFFGRQMRATTETVTSNFEYLYELNQRIASYGRYKQFEGALTVESVLASPWIFNFLLGKDTVTGSSTYTHTFARNTTVGQQSSLPSIAVESGFSPSTIGTPGTNVVRDFTGCVVKSVQMAGAVNDWIKLTTDMFFAQEQTPTSTIGPSTFVDSFAPFIFSDGKLYVPGPASTGTTIAEVQNFTITLNNNILPVYGLGSRYAAEVLAQTFTVDLKFTAVFHDSTLLNDFLSFTNLGASANPLAVKFTALDGTTVDLEGLTMAYVTDNGITGIEPNSLVLEDITVAAVDATVIATNTTASLP